MAIFFLIIAAPNFKQIAPVAYTNTYDLEH